MIHLCSVLEEGLVCQPICYVGSILLEGHHVVAIAHLVLLLRELLLGLREEFLIHLKIVLVFAHRERPIEFNLRALGIDSRK